MISNLHYRIDVVNKEWTCMYLDLWIFLQTAWLAQKPLYTREAYWGLITHMCTGYF